METLQNGGESRPSRWFPMRARPVAPCSGRGAVSVSCTDPKHPSGTVQIEEQRTRSQQAKGDRALTTGVFATPVEPKAGGRRGVEQLPQWQVAVAGSL